MQRLTKYDRQKMVDAAIERAFGQREKDLANLEDALLEDLYLKAFGRVKMSLVSSVAEQWIGSWAKEHRFEVGGMTFSIRGKNLRPQPRSSYPVARINDEVLKNRCIAVTERRAALKKEIEQAKNATAALLGSVTTLKKLKEVWPEGKEIWSLIEDKPARVQLPAVSIDQLNEVLRLP